METILKAMGSLRSVLGGDRVNDFIRFISLFFFFFLIILGSKIHSKFLGHLKWPLFSAELILFCSISP